MIHRSLSLVWKYFPKRAANWPPSKLTNIEAAIVGALRPLTSHKLSDNDSFGGTELDASDSQPTADPSGMSAKWQWSRDRIVVVAGQYLATAGRKRETE